MFSYKITHLIFGVKVHRIYSVSVHTKASSSPVPIRSQSWTLGIFSYPPAGPVVSSLFVTMPGELGSKRAAYFRKPNRYTPGEPARFNVWPRTHTHPNEMYSQLPSPFLGPPNALSTVTSAGTRSSVKEGQLECKETAVLTSVDKISHRDSISCRSQAWIILTPSPSW